MQSPLHGTPMSGLSYPIGNAPSSPLYLGAGDPMALPHASSRSIPPPLIRAPGPLIQQVNMPVMCTPTVSTMSGLESHQNEEFFHIMFVKGNISRCAGCGKRDLRGPDGKPHNPPNDLCAQHKEFMVFENPKTGNHQQSHNVRNVYYHAQMLCIQAKCAQPRIVISAEVKKKPSGVHINHIMCQFGLQVLNN